MRQRLITAFVIICSLYMSYLTLNLRMLYVTCVPLLHNFFPWLWCKLAIKMINIVLSMILKRPLIVAAYLCHPPIQLPVNWNSAGSCWQSECVLFVKPLSLFFSVFPFFLSSCQVWVLYRFDASLSKIFKKNVWAVPFVSSCKYRPLHITEYFIYSNSEHFFHYEVL